MIQVQVLTQCEHCNCEAYLPLSVAEDCQGRKYIRYAPCLMCEGSGNQPKWINLDVFAKLLHQAECPHKHTSYQGNMHFSAGGISDEIQVDLLWQGCMYG